MYEGLTSRANHQKHKTDLMADQGFCLIYSHVPKALFPSRFKMHSLFRSAHRRAPFLALNDILRVV